METDTSKVDVPLCCIVNPRIHCIRCSVIVCMEHFSSNPKTQAMWLRAMEEMGKTIPTSVCDVCEDKLNGEEEETGQHKEESGAQA